MAITMKNQLRVHFRWMLCKDKSEVFEIRQEQAWTEENFLHCLRQLNYIGMVAEHGDRIVGYMIYELHETKLHIVNLAVQPAYRRQDVGQQMVAKLISKLSSHRRTKITLEVRETNLAAQMFLRSQGFLATSILKDHYEDTNEDAYRMHYQLPGNSLALPRATSMEITDGYFSSDDR